MSTGPGAAQAPVRLYDDHLRLLSDSDLNFLVDLYDHHGDSWVEEGIELLPDPDQARARAMLEFFAGPAVRDEPELLSKDARFSADVTAPRQARHRNPETEGHKL